ncbi:interleukin-8-like [Leucoraja erinacea]|uniref:interleukin-8-like n=1 Tax=Leucoraja erinaceus TaxID=7782 RepID=UPI002454A67C|nr:interleukin-8-like [Leucoraja erinacea]
MSRTSTMAILLLLLCAFAAHGIPTLKIQRRCQCIQSTWKFIRPKFMKSIKYIPRGLNCESLEIIVKMKSGKKICVNPRAKWLKAIFKAGFGPKTKKLID